MTEPYDPTADAAHLQQQVTWLAQWMAKTNMTLTPITGVGSIGQYGGEPLTEGPFASLSEQLVTLIETQRMMDDAVSVWAAGIGAEVSPGVMTLDDAGPHYEPGDQPSLHK